jgi:ADP-heptose:LPS heptosyltransferase
MPSVKAVVRTVSDRLFGDPFERTLSRFRGSPDGRVLFFWNRGMGDISLGLVPVFDRLRTARPRARIEVATRADLAVAFQLAGVDAIHVVPGLSRGARMEPAEMASRAGLNLDAFAAVFANPDPTRWLAARAPKTGPRLRWNPEWERFASRLVPEEPGLITIGAHVNSETAHLYGYAKDWPVDHWRSLLALFTEREGVRWLLLGNTPRPVFEGPGILDLRGTTDVIELLATIRYRCRIIVAPDSGILTFVYYLADAFPIDVISIWSDPDQGILKKAAPSPNPQLHHVPIVGQDRDASRIGVAEAAAVLRAALSRARAVTPSLEQEPT